MVNEKEKTIETAKALNDIKLRNELYAKFLESKLRESEEGIKNGKVMDLTELKNYINELEKKYANTNIQ